MEKRRTERPARRGFTLIELLVVILIIVLVGAATIKVAIFDQGGRQVSEAARILQAAIGGARDAAFRANAPRGIRLLPDSVFDGQTRGALAANRMVSIEAAPDYNSGHVTIASADLTGFLTVHETVSTLVGANNIPNEPTSWYWNIRQGDKIRVDDSGRYYTIAGPIVAGAYNTSGQGATGLYNPERYVNNGPPGQWYIIDYTNPLAPVATWGVYDPNPLDGPPFGPGASPTNMHFREFLQVVNGQDDDGDGWVDEGFDGIDNDGDGVIDPGFNGIDDNGDGVVDDRLELHWNNDGEFETEQFVGNEFNSLNVGGESNKRYTILRRPVVSEGAREVALPQGVVIDLTTWNAPGALTKAGLSQPTLPERSRVPIDPYSHYVDIMIGPNGQVITAGAGQSAGSLAGGMGAFPTSNMPFYHFWIAEREDVYDPLWPSGNANYPAGMTAAMAVVNGSVVTVPNTFVPVANPNPNNQNPAPGYLLPFPKDVSSYIPPGNNGPYLTGDRRLVTLFVKTGHMLSYDLGTSDFDPFNTNAPYMHAQFGTREAK